MTTFFFVDGIVGYVKKYNSTEISLHHIFSVMMCSYTYFSGRSGYMLIEVSFWGEITNPLINLAEVMEFRGVKEKYITPLKLFFLVTFIVSRNTIGRT